MSKLVWSNLSDNKWKHEDPINQARQKTGKFPIVIRQLSSFENEIQSTICQSHVTLRFCN